MDVGLLGGVIPNNQHELPKMIKDGGVVGFKCFMIHSGIDEFPAVQKSDICEAMYVYVIIVLYIFYTLFRKVLKEVANEGMDVPFMFHAEVAGPIDQAAASLANSHPSHYSTFLHSRPKVVIFLLVFYFAYLVHQAAENEAIALVCELAREYQVPSHIVHLSSAEAIPKLREAQRQGTPISVETTFHYLHLTAEHVPDGKTRMFLLTKRFQQY